MDSQPFSKGFKEYENFEDQARLLSLDLFILSIVPHGLDGVDRQPRLGFLTRRIGMAAKVFSSPIGKKLGMALSGLVWYGFLVGHLSGNLLLLKEDGGRAFNAYSDYLVNHPLLIPAEVFLLAALALHIYLAISVARDNRRARPLGYEVTQSAGARTWASSTMLFSGLLMLVFLVLHLKTFKYGDRGDGTLYDLVVSTFQRKEYLVWYVAAMSGLGFHLWHALQSALQTLSFRSLRIKSVGLVLGLVIAAGFGFLPIYVGVLK
jgi:succinate dehydrogenase / fumarate reductase cytochrome b subunit